MGVADTARFTLAGVRLVNGTAALLKPELLARTQELWDQIENGSFAGALQDHLLKKTKAAPGLSAEAHT